MLDSAVATSESLQHFSRLLETIYDYPAPKFASEMACTSGLSCLVSEITLVKGHKRTFLYDVLAHILQDERIVCKLTAEDSGLATSLFCGSRILNCTATDVLAESWVCDPIRYTHWLALQLVQFQCIPPAMLDKAFKLGHPSEVFRVVLTVHYWEKFCICFQKLTNSSKTFILTAFLSSTHLPAPAIAAIWERLAFGSVYSMLRLALKQNIQVQRAVAMWPSAKSLQEATLKLLGDWGSLISITQFSLPTQIAQTQVLLACASQLEADQLAKLTKTVEFSQGISNHLEAQSTKVREMATVVGQVFARKAGDSLDFDIDYEHDYFMAMEKPLSLEEALACTDLDDTANNMIDEYVAYNEPEAEPEEGDSDDEDEQDVAPPVYVRDLLEYLKSSDYGKHQVAMTHGPALIRRKAKFGSEVTQYAPELLATIAGMTDKYNVNKFTAQRQNLLVALIIADPTLGEKVARILSGGDYSLYQRVSLMDALVNSARELAEYTPPEFASEMFAQPALHKSFYSEADALTGAIQKMLISSGTSSSSSQVAVSSKNQMADSAPHAPKFNAFSKIAAKYFFFPLASVSIRNYGSYTALIYQHWVKTLALLIYFSYPTNDMGDMVSQMLKILLAARSNAPEAVFTGILLLCDVAPVVLVQHVQTVGDLCDWCGQSWEQIQDIKVQRLGASAYYRLSELLRDLQSKLFSLSS